ncbi:uncharacterized protein [Palaemon carinicauda]|uniref:uncharacterized protein n=1 Tax=Palaemon carinicauda TaxID=392227 RepID=UPI0035B67D57
MTERNCRQQSLVLMLSMTLYLALIPSFMEGCNFVKNLSEETELGFLSPDIDEGEYLACFDYSEVEHPYAVTLFFNEYYMFHVNVSVCTEELLDHIQLFGHSELDAASACSQIDVSCHTRVSFNISRYLNITIPPKRNFLHPLPDILSDRPLFNITYYYGPLENVEDIVRIEENYLMYCNLNGVPRVYEDNEGKYSLRCECRDNTTGDRCQWGGDCSSDLETELCSNHGKCRYQAGKEVCICDSEYVGNTCQNKKEDLRQKKLKIVTVDRGETTGKKHLVKDATMKGMVFAGGDDVSQDGVAYDVSQDGVAYDVIQVPITNVRDTAVQSTFGDELAGYTTLTKAASCGSCHVYHNTRIMDCGNRMNCQHNCHMWNGSPFCTCDLGYNKNGTSCIASSLLWDVTLKFEGQYNSSFIKNQIHMIQTKYEMPESPVVTPPNNNSSREEAKAHFTVDDLNFSKIPPKEEWDSIFNTSVTLVKRRRFPVVELTAYSTESRLTLNCSVIGSPPLQFRFYKDSHLILLRDITEELSGYETVDYEAVRVHIERGVNSRIIVMVVDLKNYDPVIDWGTYTCAVTSKNGTNSKSSVINGMTGPFKMEILPEVIIAEKNANLTVLCTTENTWFGGNQYTSAWKIFPGDAVGKYIPRLLHWNGSELELFNITKSVHVSCYMKDYTCSAEETHTSQIIVLTPDDLYCHQNINTSHGIAWPAMVVGKTAVVNCPDDFIGKCFRKCHQKVNEKAAEWGYPNCSLCIYSPWNKIASNKEVILQGRGYPYAVQDASALATEFRNLLHNRTIPELPYELLGITNLLGKFITSNQNPVSLEHFVSVIDSLLEKFLPSIQSSTALRNLIMKYLQNNMKLFKHRKYERNFNLSVCLRVNTIRGIPYNFNFRSPCGNVSVTVLRSQRGIKSNKKMNVGVITYLAPRFLSNLTQHGKTLNDAEVLVELLETHIVDVMTFPTDNANSSPIEDEEDIVNITYTNYHLAEMNIIKRYDPTMYTWSKVCGEILLKGDELYWNFNRCLDPVEEESKDGILKCQCKGKGLFGVFLKAALVNKMINQVDDKTSIIIAVVAACCAVMVILIPVVCLLGWPRLSTNKNFGWGTFSEERENSREHEETIEHQNQPNNGQVLDGRNEIRLPFNNVLSGALYHENNNKSANQEFNIAANKTDNDYKKMDSVDETDKYYTKMDDVPCNTAVYTTMGLDTYMNMTSKNCTSNSATPEFLRTNEGQRESQNSYLPMIVRNAK